MEYKIIRTKIPYIMNDEYRIIDVHVHNNESLKLCKDN